jgi:signal transduction histidine kinase
VKVLQKYCTRLKRARRVFFPSPPRDNRLVFRSFYFRIGFSFVVFLVAVVVAQSAMFSYLLARAGNPFPNRSPNNLAAIVAADVGSTLAQDPRIDLQGYLTHEYGRIPFALWVVLKDGRVAGNTARPLGDNLKRAAEASVQGVDFRRTGAVPDIGTPAPVVMAPIQVSGELRGLVVMPPPPPNNNPLVRDLSRLLSWPGALLLIVATTIAAAVIFEPARRRLKALEEATERFGAGDLTARAPERGGDEMARVASAFNRMASELAARDEALRTSDKLRRQMLADVSHELKTPLTTMRGYVETLNMANRADVSLDAATRERYFSILERETGRLDRIVKDLVDLARFENGVAALNVRLFDIQRLFDHVVARHEHEARTRAIALTTRVASGADQVMGDPDRIEQVLENLVANALRHTPDGGAVQVTASTNGGDLVLSVQDSGEGIPPEHLPHVFERFYKVDAARSNGSGGSGLGLSISHAIVKRHGGAIHVASRPGETTFVITLPQNPPSLAEVTPK